MKRWQIFIALLLLMTPVPEESSAGEWTGGMPFSLDWSKDLDKGKGYCSISLNVFEKTYTFVHNNLQLNAKPRSILVVRYADGTFAEGSHLADLRLFKEQCGFPFNIGYVATHLGDAEKQQKGN